ncbi:polysaccharide biosynthesis tyrosine autokinase [Agreia sp. COWG]|uniref:polysaccharide biosynthesis tyrosine autokinase n=1 Tax=Agreia sp. COWG TaxID=2773266 RepID=UPI001926FD9D|nr:polysaccharide biosynthesis tyrosine autokinase [Agreia sp. COWG]CAD5991113.1 Capsular exopolysaccharide family [Agreia sp. COWG]
MALNTYLRAITTGWWIVVMTLIVGLGLASAYNSISKPVYSSSVKFFVSTQTGADQSPLQADEFAQRRINSYVQLLTSEAMIEQVIQTAKLDLSVPQLTSMISAYSDPETVLLGVEVRDTDKQRSFEIAKAVADDFGGLVAKLDNRGTTEIANVKMNVVSGPTLNNDPISPRTQLNLSLGAIVGLALGLGIAILRKTGKRSVSNDSDVKELLGVATIGAIPHLRGAPAASSSLARAAESLVTRLGLGTSGATAHRVIEVVSPTSGDGRTLVASAMASAIAGLGRRVVLVETDLRNPRLANDFGVLGNVGLVAVLSGDAEVTDALTSTPTANLDLIPAGTLGVEHAPQLLSSGALAHVIDELQARFDIVILDSAALLPSVDAAVVARSADGIVLVVNRDRSTKDQLTRAVESLSSQSAKILGAVMNTAPSPKRRAQNPTDSHTTAAASSPGAAAANAESETEEHTTGPVAARR